MKRLLAINGSYRPGGIMDQAVDAAVQAAKSAGAQVEVVHLRDYSIEFCLNCRECTQQPGNDPGTCVQNDRMQALVDKIEAADGYILASPTNFYSVTAVFKRFMERLMVYGGFNRWMQHTRNCVSRRGVADEAKTADLLHGKSESADVGALAER